MPKLPGTQYWSWFIKNRPYPKGCHLDKKAVILMEELEEAKKEITHLKLQRTNAFELCRALCYVQSRSRDELAKVRTIRRIMRKVWPAEARKWGLMR